MASRCCLTEIVAEYVCTLILLLFHKLPWYNVFVTSKRRRDVVLASQWRYYCVMCSINTLGPRKNGHHFANNIFKCIFLIGFKILHKISLKYVPWSPQAIVWTNDNEVYWRIYASLGLKDSICLSFLNRMIGKASNFDTNVRGLYHICIKIITELLMRPRTIIFLLEFIDWLIDHLYSCHRWQSTL